MSRRRPLDRAGARAVLLAFAPRPLRKARLARRHQIRWPWLHPEVDEEVNRRRAAWQAATPKRWGAALVQGW